MRNGQRYGFTWTARTREEKTYHLINHTLMNEPYTSLLKQEYEDYRLSDLDITGREPTRDEMLEHIEKALQSDPEVLVDLLTVETTRFWQPDRIFFVELVRDLVYNIDFTFFAEKTYDWLYRDKEPS